jgi:hypothetical protein
MIKIIEQMKSPGIPDERNRCGLSSDLVLARLGCPTRREAEC